MTDRNWEKELAKIDKQMASLSDDQLVARTAMPPTSGAGRDTPLAQAPVKESTNWGVAFRVGLAVALAVGVVFWPYNSRCGAMLMGYLGSLAVVMAAGVWAATATWRARSPRAHVLSLIVFVWGAALAATEVLPRIGYATDAARTAWVCK